MPDAVPTFPGTFAFNSADAKGGDDLIRAEAGAGNLSDDGIDR